MNKLLTCFNVTGEYKDMRNDFERNGQEVNTPSSSQHCFSRGNLTAHLPKRSRNLVKPNMRCGFCKKNNESPNVVSSHQLRDATGRITCPILRNYICPLCGAFGDNAHTIKYCPKYVPRILMD